MERKEILKNFLQKVVLAVFLFFLFRPVCTEENGTINYVLLWILCGIPFGIRRMFLWWYKFQQIANFTVQYRTKSAEYIYI